MVEVLRLKPNDRVLVILDPECLKCGQAFFEAARAAGCRTESFTLPETGRPLHAMPEGMAEAFDGHEVVINAMSGSSDEVPFRIEWLTLLEEAGVRVGHSPNIHEEMMDGGPMDVDYDVMADSARRLMGAFAGVSSVRIQAPAGTDMTVDLTGRRFVTDTMITEEETGVNLPCGEIYCAPVEDGANGVLVADGPIGGEGPPPSPVTLTVEHGRVTGVSCADASWTSRITELLDTDDGARIICELGIGLNPKARLVGIMLEDEKAERTAHIAFGSNIGMPGGVNHSDTHIDYLFHRPTITATNAAGSATTLVDDGVIQV
jgi:leucyl aminopeptidase (aminopeptidase T)